MLLSRVDLHAFNFLSMGLRGANLSFANMNDTHLVNAKLNNANLAFTQMDRANLGGPIWPGHTSPARQCAAPTSP
jgi:uncharacterized protein YjbI with pentapeptide repeats